MTDPVKRKTIAMPFNDKGEMLLEFTNQGGSVVVDEDVDGFPRTESGAIAVKVVGEGVVQVSASRSLTAADDGKVLEMTAAATLTVPAGLPNGFAVAVIPSGTTSVAFSGGSTGNGAATTITRAAASNAMFAIQQRGTNASAYVVTGA